ncbi:Plug and carboxypeptidase regulatory-like domain-containing protein [Granulicella cerasi]|uniref:Plug and carboxypeptidase regulatory-like domain-containing protein n=1 Tax=Granulicella cerasi TaxID=741063 RepID=A0ABW1ZAJ4_9BACT|nr:Plug and carboxypeptidase regulatory-like domain-containing protein [Granulicella cerasi]
MFTNKAGQKHAVKRPLAWGRTRDIASDIFSLRAAAPIVFAMAAASAGAQVTSGSIFGTVQDSTGAVIPGAKIVASAPSIGASRTVTSSGNGTFSIPNLPPGSYTLTITAKGFSSLVKDGVILNPADHLSAGTLALQVGSESASVTVSADTGQLQIQANSGERSDLITGKQLNDIALNGRNVLDILRVIPGVSGTGTFGASSTGGLDTYSVNGTRTNQHQFTMDGASNVDTGNNGGTQVTLNTDAIAEVKVLTSNFQAEFGKAGGGSIAVTSRGGTNDFHGNAHFFHRNEGLNANDWVSDHNGTSKPLYRYNTFGYQVGGPIKKDKLYFFFSNEFYRQLIPAGLVQYRTPTALERTGDFSRSVDSGGNALQIVNPATGTAFVNNTITAAQMTAAETAAFAQTQRILALFPLPNVANNNSYNRQDPQSDQHPRTEYVGRVDYQITPNERLFARYINNQDTQTGPVGTFGLICNGTLIIPGGCTDKQPGWNLSVDLTSTLSPRVLNEVSIGPSVYKSQITGNNGNLSRQSNNIDLPLLYPVAADSSIPDISFTGNGASYPGSYFGATPWHQASTTIDANDNLTWSLHSHTLKFGVFYQRARKDQIAWGNANGQYSFSNCSTSAPGCVAGASSAQGSPIASALLGYFTSFDQSSARPTGYFRYNQVEFYAQDTWQVTPRFTLDYGVRFVYIPPQYDAHNQIALFTPSAYRAADAVTIDTSGNIVPGTGNPLNGMTYSNNGTLPKGGWNGQGIMPEPRVGFAWDFYGDHKGVIRGGFGTSHDRSQGNLVFNTVFGNPAVVTTPSISNNTFAGISSSAVNASTGVLSGIYGADRSGQVPVTYSYSLGVQREVGGGVSLDVAYVGNVGRHQVTARDLNTIPYGTTFTRAAQNPANFAGGVVPTVEPNLPPEYAAAGYSFSGQYAYQQNYLSPYKGYGQMEYYKFDGTSSYNSLQASVLKRYSRSLTFGGFYTWSKTLTTSSSDESFVDPFNPRKYSYGVASYDRRSVAAINYVYSLPNFSQLFHAARWMGVITDGFQLSGLASMQSGAPVINALWYPANQLTGGSQWSKIPPAFVGVDSLGNLIKPTIGYPTLAARGSLRQGGLVTWDQSIFKNFNFGKESKGRYLQIRGEFFNILNHPNIAARDYNANVTLPSYNGTYTPLSVSKDSNWGQPTSAFSNLGPGGPRVIQLAGKLYF